MFSKMQRSLTKQFKSLSTSPSMLSTFTPQQIARFLQNPLQFEAELRQLSNYLYSISGYYRSIIQFFALMPKDAYTVEPYVIPDVIDNEQYKKAYFKNLKEIEKMNLSKELIKVRKIAFKEDVYFGYAVDTKNSTFLLHLDPNYCQISSINEYGLYNFCFDFSFFDDNPEVLDSYPEEFRRKYGEYLKTNDEFIELESPNAMCIKVNSDLLHPLIPFSTVFESLLDLDEYEKIAKQRTKMDNFLLLTQQIPMGDKNQIDFFNISPDMAGDFHNMLSNAVDEMGIAVTMSPMELKAVRMERSKSDSNAISQAQSNIYSDAGVPQQIFSSDKSSAVGVKYSVMMAEQIAFSVMRQIETWINRRLESMSGRYKFHIKMLDITVFNEKEKSEAYHKASTVGLPVINEYASSIGISPLDLYNKAVLENDVLGLHDLLRPLATSYTQSKSDSEGGREKMEDAEISEQTEIWRESDSSQVDDI